MTGSFKDYMIRGRPLKPCYDEVFGTLREFGPPQQFEKGEDSEEDGE